ncbi:hypothetical protein [Streptomyces sp. TLI_171]|uniref:hypothetical protein n=1 Tax=Streptomyces sp. TLI_171 TaxID=1938859 RepID=UPI000C1A4790|nr:hypothetical protein [Streptomyces sp. TLI_171]RKE17234.1 hypothetical protein BX266_0489 [Streptomyces sp. TLI_171]
MNDIPQGGAGGVPPLRQVDDEPTPNEQPNGEPPDADHPERQEHGSAVTAEPGRARRLDADPDDR